MASHLHGRRKRYNVRSSFDEFPRENKWVTRREHCMAASCLRIPQNNPKRRLHVIYWAAHADSVRMRLRHSEPGSTQACRDPCDGLRVRPEARAKLCGCKPEMIVKRSLCVLRLEECIQLVQLIPQREEHIELHTLLRGGLGGKSERLCRRQESAKQYC